MCSANWCSSVEVLTITCHHPSAASAAETHDPARLTSSCFTPDGHLTAVRNDKSRHPRAHSTAEPPHSMPNWVVKRSRANDTRTAGSRKSRSARGFFLYLFSFPREAVHHRRRERRTCAGVAQLVEHYLAKVDVASSNLVSRSTFTPSPEGFFHC